MGKAQFIIHCDGESLAHWLQANWQAPAGNPAAVGDGLAYLQPPIWNPERRQITAGAWVTGEAAAHGPAIPEVIRFDLLPLGDGRLEIVATCEPLFDVFLVDLLIEMAKRWPEALSTLGLRDLPTLRSAPAGNGEPEPGPKPEPGQPEPARDDKPAPNSRGRSKAVRQEKIRKLFEVEKRRDLTVGQMARWYGVTHKTINRDLTELGYKDKLPP